MSTRVAIALFVLGVVVLRDCATHRGGAPSAPAAADPVSPFANWRYYGALSLRFVCLSLPLDVTRIHIAYPTWARLGIPAEMHRSQAENHGSPAAVYDARFRREFLHVGGHGCSVRLAPLEASYRDCVFANERSASPPSRWRRMQHDGRPPARDWGKTRTGTERDAMPGDLSVTAGWSRNGQLHHRRGALVRPFCAALKCLQ